MITKALREMKNAVYEGLVDPLETYAELKRIEAELKEAKDVIESAALAEAEKFAGKSFEYKGMKFERREGRRNFSFKGIGTWEQKKNDLSEYESVLKTAFEQREKGVQMVDENGEIIPIPKCTFSKSSLVFKG